MMDSSYHSDKYKWGDKSSFERFHGDPESHNFKIKEWEVWRIDFTSDEEEWINKNDEDEEDKDEEKHDK